MDVSSFLRQRTTKYRSFKQLKEILQSLVKLEREVEVGVGGNDLHEVKFVLVINTASVIPRFWKNPIL